VAWGHPKGLKAAEAGGDGRAEADVRRLQPWAPRSCAWWLEPRLPQRSHEPQIRALTGIFKEVASIAQDQGVRVAVENHFDFTIDEYVDLLDRIDSDYFGMCYDTGNTLRNGGRPGGVGSDLGP